ncbi:ABC transporter ATP-binding protein [Anaerobium acetethylicum]|uniref:Putative ABC transport system ATP-binding protein n=1 Tax=Anaerobium acetethylicum TaxID=1619234 RepID=A0A1D3TVD1_9FIRM|nr:ATP-binding cassette domain-containing protein [Anaerobium acetethylicum]SCP98086.1 putative ABC transport system ATP-binding protein [Anaerobium acetethylicum]
MLELKNINKYYNSGTVNEMCLFNNFNLTIKDHEFVSVIGSNGSGKTSLLNIICGSIATDSGNLIMQGSDITGEKEFRRYRKIGRVYQNPAMGTCPSMTILENMSLADNKGKPYNLGSGTNRKRAEFYRESLRQLNLGLEDKMNVKVGSLSGGQRQAMALLMSTMTPIEFLILDEHTAALDPKTAETIMELTDQIVKEKKLTTIMVTHNLRYALEYGNRLLMMHQGEAVLDKSAAEKAEMSIDDLLGVFNQISIECGN